MSDEQQDLAQRIATDINGHEARTVSRVRIIGIVHAHLAADPTLKAVREALAGLLAELGSNPRRHWHSFMLKPGEVSQEGYDKAETALAALDRLMGKQSK